MDKEQAESADNFVRRLKNNHVFHSPKCALPTTSAASNSHQNDTSTIHTDIQNFVLLWLDPSINQTDPEFQKYITLLKSSINTIHIFTDTDQCIDFLTDIEHKKVFLVVSGLVYQHIISLIHDVLQLRSICVISENKSQYRECMKEWPKVKKISADIISICETLQKVAQQCDHNNIVMSFVPADDVLHKELNELDQSFMYTQLVKEILLDIDHTDTSINDFTDHCRKLIGNNKSMLEFLAKFQREYHAQEAIWWYTCNSCLYPTLNRALRMQEVNTIIAMGFFVRDLHERIQELHSKQFFASPTPTPLTVFRGQGLSISDFQKLKQTKGGLLSFNNFLSTSSDRDVAFILADSNALDPNCIGILFEVTIDSKVERVPFAFIESVGAFRSENEVLFSMDSIFRVGEMTNILGNNRLWRVELTLTSDTDPLLNALMERMRQEIGEGPPLCRMAELLVKVGEYTKTEQLYRSFLDKTVLVRSRALCYNQLGLIRNHQGHPCEALALFNEASELYQQCLPQKPKDLAICYDNIALMYCQMGDYTNSLTVLEKSIQIQEKFLSPYDIALAGTYRSFASIYSLMGERSKAFAFSEKVLVICEKTLPLNHPLLALAYENAGSMYKQMGDYSKALTLQEKSLAIRQKSLPPNHPDLAFAYEHVGDVYEQISEYSKALSFREKALDLRQKMQPVIYPDLARSYTSIGSTYYKMREYSRALSYHERALTIEREVLSENSTELSYTLDHIGMACRQLGEYSKALACHEEALEIRKKSLLPGSDLFGSSYNNIGLVFEVLGEYSSALSFHEQAMAIFEKTQPPSKTDLAFSYTNIGKIYTQMGRFSQALPYHEKAIEIKQEIFPPYHPSLATSYTLMAITYRQMGDYSKALHFDEKTVEINEKIYPPSHMELAECYVSIGMTLREMSEYLKALDFFQKALRIKKNGLPGDHLELATIYSMIGDIYAYMGDFSKTFSFHERALSIAQNWLPPNHPFLRNLQDNIKLKNNF